MALRAKKPEIGNKKLRIKMMISGRPGVGKTMFALEFPSVYFLDTESGATRDQYQKKMLEKNAVYFGKEDGSQHFQTIIEEIKSLATTKHDYKTLVIDSFSHLYDLTAAIAEERVGNDYSKDKKEANRPTRQLMRWLEDLDMNVILICHQKDKWERVDDKPSFAGTTFDGYAKLEYILDLWIEIKKDRATKRRSYEVKKSRIDSFIEGTENPLDYKEFAQGYGLEVLNKESTPMSMATAEQVSKLKEILSIVSVDSETQDKWKDKCKVESWEEMTSEQIQKCIDFTQTKLDSLSKTKK